MSNTIILRLPRAYAAHAGSSIFCLPARGRARPNYLVSSRALFSMVVSVIVGPMATAYRGLRLFHT